MKDHNRWYQVLVDHKGGQLLDRDRGEPPKTEASRLIARDFGIENIRRVSRL